MLSLSLCWLTVRTCSQVLSNILQFKWNRVTSAAREGMETKMQGAGHFKCVFQYETAIHAFLPNRKAVSYTLQRNVSMPFCQYVEGLSTGAAK